MPTVLRLDGWKAVIYPNDHRPSHVHVIGAGREAVLYLNCPSGPAELRENYGFSIREINRIQHALIDRLEKLCRAWERIHGNN
jgi:hypothetical protein